MQFGLITGDLKTNGTYKLTQQLVFKTGYQNGSDITVSGDVASYNPPSTFSNPTVKEGNVYFHTSNTGQWDVCEIDKFKAAAEEVTD